MPYNGTVCKEYLGNRPIHYNLTYPNAALVNENIVIRLLEEMVETFDELCRIPAVKLMCHYAFPDCDMSTGVPTSKPLCRLDFLLFTSSASKTADLYILIDILITIPSFKNLRDFCPRDNGPMVLHDAYC